MAHQFEHLASYESLDEVWTDTSWSFSNEHPLTDTGLPGLGPDLYQSYPNLPSFATISEPDCPDLPEAYRDGSNTLPPLTSWYDNEPDASGSDQEIDVLPNLYESKAIAGTDHIAYDTCFGSLRDLKFQLFPDAASLLHSGAWISNTRNEFLRLNMDFQRDTMILIQSQPAWNVGRSGVDRNSDSSAPPIDIALLNTKTTEILRKLIEKVPHLSMEAVVNLGTWKQDLKKSRQRSKAILTTAAINIYGLKECSERVPLAFSSLRLFLQRSELYDVTVKQQNPQLLSFDKALFHDDDDLTLSNEDNPSDCFDVLDNLPDYVQLEGQYSDIQTCTSLLPHQKVGVDFIRQRETGHPPHALRLWQNHMGDDNLLFYRHIISGDKISEVPSEVAGGILADEMGLGKTLTMLAAISSPSSKTQGDNFLADMAQYSRSGQFACKATLVVVPSLLILKGWLDEIKTHLNNSTLKVHKYHGYAKEIDHERLKDYDIILTTYATIMADSRNHKWFRSVHWFRLVLDEAHIIRTPSTTQFRDMAALRAEIRWCITGTPIQNKLEDLGALITFLRTPVLEDSSNFRQHIVEPSERLVGEAGHSHRFSNLRTLLGALCLRRTKNLIHLEEPEFKPRILDFTPTERQSYDNIQTECKRALDNAIARKDLYGARTLTLKALNSSRRFCNTGIVLPLSSSSTSEAMNDGERFEILARAGEASCAGCSVAIPPPKQKSPRRLSDHGKIAWRFADCSHILCQECVTLFKAGQMSQSSCSICTQTIELSTNDPPLSRRNINQREIAPTKKIEQLPNEPLPTKIRALLDDVISCEKETKCIVFSFWLKTLNMIQPLLEQRGVEVCRVDGELSDAERERALERFKKATGRTTALLMTLSTGAEGLNISVASRVFILEPQWNPQVERQAIGRVMRLGQRSKVVITRYMIRDSIEDSKVKLHQKRKLNLASGGFGRDADIDKSSQVRQAGFEKLQEIVSNMSGFTVEDSMET